MTGGCFDNQEQNQEPLNIQLQFSSYSAQFQAEPVLVAGVLTAQDSGWSGKRNGHVDVYWHVNVITPPYKSNWFNCSELDNSFLLLLPMI